MVIIVGNSVLDIVSGDNFCSFKQGPLRDILILCCYHWHQYISYMNIFIDYSGAGSAINGLLLLLHIHIDHTFKIYRLKQCYTRLLFISQEPLISSSLHFFFQIKF